MDAARARRLREADETVLLEHLARAQRRRRGPRRRAPGHRVEVDAQLVGMVEVAAANGPRVPVDHAQVHAPHEVCGVVDDELARAAPAGEGDGRASAATRARCRARASERTGCPRRRRPSASSRSGARAGGARQPPRSRGSSRRGPASSRRCPVRSRSTGARGIGEEHLGGVAHAHLAPAHLDDSMLALASHPGRMPDRDLPQTRATCDARPQALR